ncbi:hypothetical protein POTOM_022679 [Populus tomentosa]|uniref:Uncharacterized protein n=1 Tax=Populus tomentosa TaxID=118781 RepID=A0A8X7ZLW9_POPTO|nr:hypothetical protein POTOM_022679 [Populus tomentosa]
MADIEDYAIPFLIFLASILLVQIILAKIRRNDGLPPSPRALPIIGHMHLLSRMPHQAFHKLSARYGPLVYFFIGSKPCLLASTPEVAEEILKINEANFLNRPKVANLDYLTYGSADFATIYYGPHWKFMKKLCMTKILGSRTLTQFLPTRCEARERFLKLVLKRAEAKEAVDVGGELMRLANDVMSRMLLRTRCSDTENEADDNIFGAGTDTSSIAVEWGLAELINHPITMEKVRQEIDSVVGRSRLVQESDIANLPYLQAVVKETLRLHPTGPLIVRESLEDCTIAGYRIPAKTRLFVNIWSIGRDPNHWENPLEFRPERFTSEEWSASSNMVDSPISLPPPGNK